MSPSAEVLRSNRLGGTQFGITGNFGATNHLLHFRYCVHRNEHNVWMIQREDAEDLIREGLSDAGYVIEVEYDGVKNGPRVARAAWLASVKQGFRHLPLQGARVLPFLRRCNHPDR